MTLQEIFKSLEKSKYEIDTESRLARVGLKDEQKIAPILKKYDRLYDLLTVNFVKENYKKETKPNIKEQLRLLFFELADFFLYKKVAEIDDRLSTFFNKAEVELEGEKIPFYNLGPLISKTADFGKRERLQEAGFKVLEKANPNYLLMTEKVIETAKNDLGFADYIDFYQNKKRMDYFRFQGLVAKINSRLQGLYREKMEKFVEENLNRPWQKIKNCHAPYLLNLNRFDQYFPKEKLMPVFEASMKDLGFDIKNQPNIQIDTEERPKKNPRAVCYPAKVPQEIHLIIKPIGGFYDFTAFFHEAGHSEHHAHVKASLPFAFRHLESSNALAELFSFLFESLTRNPLWLEKYLGLDKQTANQITYDSEMANFYMLIRYLAKFSYEYQLLSSGDLSLGPQLYAKTLTKFTNFVYSPVSYLSDLDDGFYSADYLRAWIGEAQLISFFEKKFGKNWFEKREVGHWLKKIWQPGSQFELEELLEKNKTGEAFDINPLVLRFKKSLAKK